MELKVARTLGRIGGPAVDPLLAVLPSQDEWLRRGALEALSDIDDTRAQDAVEQAARRDRSDSVRQFAKKLADERALGNRPDADATGKVSSTTTTVDRRTVFELIDQGDKQALLGSRSAVEALLLDELQHPTTPENSRMAVSTLIAIGNDAIEKRLLEYLENLPLSADANALAEVMGMYLTCGNVSLHFAAERWTRARGVELLESTERGAVLSVGETHHHIERAAPWASWLQ